MKRWLWLAIAGLFLGVIIASFLSRDPGYALLQVNGYRLETSLVALVLAGTGLFVFLRLIGRLARIALGIFPGFGRWLGKRREEQNLELIQSSLDDVLSEDTASLLTRVGKLEKSSWHSESRAKQLRQWLLTRQIRASGRASQLNKIWSRAQAADKAETPLRVEYISRLYQQGATNDVDVVLFETAILDIHRIAPLSTLGTTHCTLERRLVVRACLRCGHLPDERSPTRKSLRRVKV